MKTSRLPALPFFPPAFQQNEATSEGTKQNKRKQKYRNARTWTHKNIFDLVERKRSEIFSCLLRRKEKKIAEKKLFIVSVLRFKT